MSNNRIAIIYFIFGSIFTLVIAGCGKETSIDSDTGLATIGIDTITVEQLEAEVGVLTGGNVRAVYPGTYETALNRMIDLKIVEREAKTRDLSSSKEYKQAIQAIHDRMAREEREIFYRLLLDDVSKRTELSEDELKAYYQQVKNRYLTATIQLRRIEVGDEKTVREVKKKLDAKKKFSELAAEFNLDSGLKKNKGDMGVMIREEVPRALRVAAFSLRDVNQISDPFYAEGKWNILQLVSLQSGVERPFESLKPQLEQELRHRKSAESFQKLLAERRKELKVEIHNNELNKLTTARRPQPTTVTVPQASMPTTQPISPSPSTITKPTPDVMPVKDPGSLSGKNQ